MDERVMAKLEFDHIRRMLAEETAFTGGRELALRCQPFPSVEVARRGQIETAEALQMMTEAGDPPFGGVTDVRAPLQRARRQGVLTADELNDIAHTLAASNRIQQYLIGRGSEIDGSVLVDFGDILSGFPHIVRAIRKCIDEEGHVLDTASPLLQQIRSRWRQAEQRVRRYLNNFVRSSQGRRVLQEPIVTLRDGRFVVPIKSEHKGAVDGIVHDQSSSGATLFVEPRPVVEANNEMRRLELEQNREVTRILTELSELVATEVDGLGHEVAMLADIDLIFAKARLALKMKAVPPRLNANRRLHIVSGRHPLLTGHVVPIDVTLENDVHAMVITGPNTGGKTVALKTIGLFIMMGASGLHVPAAENTDLPFPRRIHVDIGDEQSIEQSLSTFSAHMRHIVQMQNAVDERTVVLLDELGAGTDPTEGSALAIALLEHFISAGALVVATTHYSELKAFAYTYPGVENASVQFDVDTLQPTYRLSMGVAGESNALAIAKRLGLSDRILTRARQQLSEDEKKVGDMIAAVSADLEQARRDKEDARILKQRYEQLAKQYDDMTTKLEAERQKLVEDARNEAAALVRDARLQSEQLLGRLRQTAASKRTLEETALNVREGYKALQKSLSPAPKPSSSGRVKPEDVLEVAPGQTVHVRSLNTTAEVVQDLGSGKYLVQAGAVRLTVSGDDLTAVSGSSGASKSGGTQWAKSRPGAAYSAVSLGKATSISTDIHLRGMVVEEGLEMLDKFLDDAVLAGSERLRIVHGKGTGRMRGAVHTFLRSDTRVRSFEIADPREGGSGVTVVHL